MIQSECCRLLVLGAERLLRLERWLRSCCWRRWWYNGGGLALLGCGLDNNLIDGRFQDLDGVGEGLAWTELALGIPTLHAVGI